MTSSSLLLSLILVISLLHFTLASRKLTQNNQQLKLQYQKGPILTRKISINLIWYGKFKPSQRAIISDFINSITSPTITAQPSVATWWKFIDKYYHFVNSQKNIVLTIGSHFLDENYSFGKSLTNDQIIKLASNGSQTNSINVVLISDDVVVDGFCYSRCGTHSFSVGTHNTNTTEFAYVWVGNSETQCLGQCAWPFHQPIYGP